MLTWAMPSPQPGVFETPARFMDKNIIDVSQHDSVDQKPLCKEACVYILFSSFYLETLNNSICINLKLVTASLPPSATCSLQESLLKQTDSHFSIYRNASFQGPPSAPSARARGAQTDAKRLSKIPSKAGGIIIYKYKVLLVQSYNKKWGFPKGSLKPGESFLECSKREIKEETSLDLKLTENDRLLATYCNTVMYYKRLQIKPVIKLSQIYKYGEDCTGVCWMRLSCLQNSVLEHEKQLAQSGDNKPTSIFTLSLRRFVKHYF